MKTTVQNNKNSGNFCIFFIHFVKIPGILYEENAKIPGIFVVLNCCFHQNFPEFYALLLLLLLLLLVVVVVVVGGFLSLLDEVMKWLSLLVLGFLPCRPAG